MQHQTSLLLELSKVLKEIGNKKCLDKAKSLENLPTHFRSLNFRSLDLNAENVLSISVCISKFQTPKQLKSISFSYNQNMGDVGVKALVENLPKSLTEIGLVGCGIKDEGGQLVLGWIKTLPNLNVICIENNHFTETIKQSLKNYSNQHPEVLVVY